MSVKLIVVALLAAAAVADATAKKTVKTTMCADGDNCECTEPTVKEYATTCTAGADKIFWKADSCDDSTANFVVKGYSKEGCAEEPRKVPQACTALYYYKAECTGTKPDGTVKLYINCTTQDCETAKCAEPLTFKLGDTSADACQQVADKYYKLKGETCPSNGQSVAFEQYSDDKCTTKTNKQIDAPTTTPCTASHYQKSECDTTGKKVTVTTCSDKSCADCVSNPVEVPFQTYKEVAGETVYIESCTAEEKEYTFQVYAGVKQYSKTCAAVTGGHAMAACVTETTTETTTTETVNETTNETTTTEGSGIIAPAHTAGVLALVLCLLACVY